MSEFEKIHVNKMKVLEEFNWAKKTGVGYGLNGMQFIGKKGDSYEVEGDAGQFDFIGAKYDSMGSASVYQNGKKVATINKDSINEVDKQNMKFASKSYKQIMYLSKNITKPATFNITVDSGEIILNGILKGENCSFIEEPEDETGINGSENDNNDAHKGDKKSGSSISGIVIGIVFAIVIVV